MKLTFKEMILYDKLQHHVGLNKDESNLMARFGCLYLEFMEIYSDMYIFDFEGGICRFCINSGRITSSEFNSAFEVIGYIFTRYGCNSYKWDYNNIFKQ